MPVTARAPHTGVKYQQLLFFVFFRLESGGNVIPSQGHPPMAEVCAQIKNSGYAQSKKVRIYGEEFEILSDPFPNEIGIAVRVRSRRTWQVRHLQLPATIIHRASRGPKRAA